MHCTAVARPYAIVVKEKAWGARVLVHSSRRLSVSRSVGPRPNALATDTLLERAQMVSPSLAARGSVLETCSVALQDLGRYEVPHRMLSLFCCFS